MKGKFFFSNLRVTKGAEKITLVSVIMYVALLGRNRKLLSTVFILAHGITQMEPNFL